MQRWPVLLLILAAGGAAAQDEINRQALEGCAGLETPADRLECYDTVVGREPNGIDSGGEPVGDASSEADEPNLTGQPDTQLMLGGNGEPVDEAAAAEEPSPLAKRWELVAQAERGPFVITPYKPTYLIPLSYNLRPNPNAYEGTELGRGYDRLEAKFQISFKVKIWPDLVTPRGDLWFGYTQTSYWQVYNDDVSAPFRETNYQPELIYAYEADFELLGLNARVLTLSLNHTSNGRSQPLSRSWNRLIGGILLDQGNLAFRIRAWYRLPDVKGEDDNPDILDYMGRGEIWTHYKDGGHTYSLMLRSNFDPEDVRGAAQASWSFPLGGAVKGYVQYFWGYGDGLIDYNHINNRLSLGLMLTDWM